MKKTIDLLKRIYHKLPEPPSTNYAYRMVNPGPYDALPIEPVIYDIGAKGAGGKYAFGKPPVGSRVVCVDIEGGPGVDLVADAHDLHMVDDNTVDCVVCVSVLTHVKYPAQVMKEVHRILKPGGVVYVSIPFIYPYHTDPYDFYRFSCQGMAILCEDFEQIETGFNRGPASTMLHLSVHFIAILLSFNNKTLYGLNVDLLKWMFFWVKYLDKFIGHYEVAYVIHADSYFMGKKQTE